MRAAVIDVGSNSIKLLVADRGPEGRPAEVLSRTLEVRISRGIGSDRPQLTPEGMTDGTAAIASLASEARGLGADPIRAVATSAVRDASNGAEFRDRVRLATGLELRVLTGREEANLIGRGLTTDPALAVLPDFRVYDLGGGSLECLSFKKRLVQHEVSLPLGCVRLTEMFFSPPTGPFTESAGSAIARHVRNSLQRSGFPLLVPEGEGVVGTGGTLTTARAIAAARRGVRIDRSDRLIEVAFLRQILAELRPLDLAARKAFKGLTPSRADVYPAALVTLIQLAELSGIRAFHHSLRNLRWGVAADLLK
jgi:exopolyphosphatase/guanosine-5'-triphosphate,3'-diphosphate pyrophosphatase